MQVEYARGGKIRFSLRKRPLDRDTEDVRKNRCAGCTIDCERRDITVGNLSSGQAPNTLQTVARNQKAKKKDYRRRRSKLACRC